MRLRQRSTTVRRRRVVRTALGGLLALSVGAVPVLPGVSLSPANAYTKWQSGVYTGQCGKAAVTTFGTWRHAKVERTSGYLSANSWSSIYTVGGIRTCLAKAKVPVTLSVPMLPNKVGNLISGSKGAYNAYWTKFGKTLMADGYQNATLRIGWEMNGSWFSWSAAKDPTHWKRYWAQIVKTLRKTPKQHFTFEWSPALGSGTGHFNVAQAYPGDAYVDYVGSTVYDQWWGNASATVAQRWAHQVTEPYGLTWIASFAKKHHKKVAIAEWGLASATSFGGHGDGDNAYFISHFYAWLKKSNVVYEIYFNRKHQTNEHRLTLGTITKPKTNPTFKNAANLYRKTFGGG